MKNLSKNERLMVAINSIYNFCSSMSSVFMNVYLYVYTGTLVSMAIYTALRIFMFPFFFTLAGKWANKHSYSLTLSIGLLLQFLQLALVLGFNDAFGVNPYLVYSVALVGGIGESFFWMSINSLNQLVSPLEHRTSYVSDIGIGNNLASIVAPLVASLLIDLSPTDNEGYVLIFRIVLGIYLFLVFLAFQVKVNKKSQPFSVLRCLNIKSCPEWHINMIGATLYGFRDSVTLMLAGILVYNATGGSGGLYGRLLSFFAVLTILSYGVYGRVTKKKDVLPFYRYGGFAIASSTIVLVLCPNLFGALYYGIVNALAAAFYANGFSLKGMEAISSYDNRENITGRVIAREIYLSIGRILGMLFIVLCYSFLPENWYLKVSVILLSLFPIVASTYTQKRYEKYGLDHEKG